MALNPQFSSVPKIGRAALSAANTNRDGTGSVVTLITASTTGCLIDGIICTATSTTTAGMLRVFVYDGANYDLIREIPVSAVTPSASVAVWSYWLNFPTPIILPNGYSLRCSTHNAETFRVVALAGDL